MGRSDGVFCCVRVIVTASIVTLVGGTSILAQSSDAAGVRSTSARAAVQRFERTVASAQAEYERKLKEASVKAKVELEQSLKEALRKADLDEANRIRDAITATEESAKPVESSKKPAISDLADRDILFFNLKPGVATLRLGPDGVIVGSKNPNEAAWRVSPEGFLQFVTREGRPTSEFRHFMRSSDGIFMWGPFTGGPSAEWAGIMIPTKQ